VRHGRSWPLTVVNKSARIWSRRKSLRRSDATCVVFRSLLERVDVLWYHIDSILSVVSRPQVFGYRPVHRSSVVSTDTIPSRTEGIRGPAFRLPMGEMVGLSVAGDAGRWMVITNGKSIQNCGRAAGDPLLGLEGEFSRDGSELGSVDISASSVLGLELTVGDGLFTLEPSMYRKQSD